MTEYIEREAISEEIRKFYYKNPPNFSYGEGFDRGLDRAQRAILDAPAADVVEVVHGQWEWDTEDIYRCSNCTEKSHVKEVMGHPEWDYCPNCGAKMDGDDDNGAMV